MKLINASDLKLYIMRYLLIDEDSTTEEIERQMLRAIDVQPAIDAKVVRHGQWESYFEDVELYNTGGFTERKQTGWICGRCKSVKSITQYYKTNYCPNCGAKMDEMSG